QQDQLGLGQLRQHAGHVGAGHRVGVDDRVRLPGRDLSGDGGEGGPLDVHMTARRKVGRLGLTSVYHQDLVAAGHQVGHDPPPDEPGSTQYDDSPTHGSALPDDPHWRPPDQGPAGTGKRVRAGRNMTLVTLSFDDHLAAIQREGELFMAAVSTGDLDATVPTCPEWTLRELAHHLGRTHIW